MATLSDLQTNIDAARTAIAASDWTTAENELLQAQAALAGLVEGRQGPTEIRYRNDIESLLAIIRRKRASSLGLQHTLVNRTELTS